LSAITLPPTPTPKKKFGLQKKCYNAVISILQKHYLKNQGFCHKQHDKYAFDNNLPEIKVVRDEDKSVEKPVTFEAAIDDCLFKLSGVKCEDIRQRVSEIFLNKNHIEEEKKKKKRKKKWKKNVLQLIFNL
jgi:hypothetical protein